MESIDKQQLKPPCYSREARDDTIEDHQQYRTRSDESLGYTCPRELVAAEVVHQYQCRDGQEVQQVDTNRQSHQISDEYEPFVGACLVRFLVPFENEPHDYCCEER